MLTREIMGGAALVVMWTATLLICLAAFGLIREMWRRLRAMRGNLHRGTVVEGEEDGVLAVQRVAQVGRRAADDAERRAILFHDCDHESVLFGGAIEVEGTRLTLPSSDAAEIWPDHARRAALAAEGSVDGFDEAYRPASRAKGFRRVVETPLSEGDEVWVVARREGDALAPLDGGSFVVAAESPRRFAWLAILQLGLFIDVVLALASGITWLCLQPPLFGTVSTVGGVAGLIYFLLVQGGGTIMRDRVRVPSRTFLRGSWVQAGSEGLGVEALGVEPTVDPAEPNVGGERAAS